MATRAEYIAKNYESFNSFVKMGEIPSKTMMEYKTYCFFTSLKVNKVMHRYAITAEEMKMKEDRVRRAVARMKQKI